MEAGDAQWTPTTKELLGLVYDGTTSTVHMTHRKRLSTSYTAISVPTEQARRGFWFRRASPQELPETVWRLQWLRDITAAVVTESNPEGIPTNSDLERAAVVLNLS